MANKFKLGNLCERELLEKILRILERLEKLQSTNKAVAESCLYDNKSLIAKLGIKDKYLKKLRDNGYIGYSRVGDKYWYTQEDVERFLCRFHYDDFAIGDELPRQKENLSSIFFTPSTAATDTTPCAMAHRAATSAGT